MRRGDMDMWSDEQRRRHRLRRALHELVSDPRYTLRAEGDRLTITPKDVITPEADAFIKQYKTELVTHLHWLGEVS
jgi:hypothetical protein